VLYSPTDGAAMRLVAAMVGPGPGSGRHAFKGAAEDRMSPFAIELVENDAQYFRRRAGEERRAAAAAAGPEASSAHEDLARRYARLSQRWTPPARIIGPRSARSASFEAETPMRPSGQSRRLPDAEDKRRLDDLLDEALLETFPASDPVSIVHVR